MPVDSFVDKIIHRPYTGGPQAVGKLIGENVGLNGLSGMNF
jgi:hypothetical protein